MRTRQEQTDSPSINTVHEPHSPFPQLSLLPVKSKDSRSTSNNVFVGGHVTETAFPFTLKRIVFNILTPIIYLTLTIEGIRFNSLLIDLFASSRTISLSIVLTLPFSMTILPLMIVVSTSALV